MIGQHLILRCAKGCYDHANAAGLKTAAVSESISKLEGARQQELNKVISEHAQFPDITVRSGTGVNRGVLRLFNYRGVLMAMRTSRVHDLCDTGGSVSFTHTYMIADDSSGNDRQYLLAHPESFCELSSFDDYKAVAARTKDGLNSGNPITVNNDLKMPDKSLKRFDDKIFEECGINADVFAQIIGAVCKRVSSKGWVALITKNISEESWNNNGGSLEGEKLITAFMALLPDCIRRFLSAVSFWNSNPSDDCLKDYQLRVLSGKYSENLVDSEISLFNLRDGKINSDVHPGAFGRYLWKIKGDAEELERFHTFIEDAFGKNVDKIAKVPPLMDALTDLYLFTTKAKAKTDGDKSKAKVNKYIEESEVDEQNALGSFLLSMGTSLPVFQNIYEGASMLSRSIREHEQETSERLETVIMQLLKNSEASKLESCFEDLVAILMHSVKSGTAKDKTVAMIGEQLDHKDGQKYRDQFGKILEKLVADGDVIPPYPMLSLLIDSRDIPMLKNRSKEISELLKKFYVNAFDHKDFELCAKMTVRQLKKELPPERVAELGSRVVELADKVSPEVLGELVAEVSGQFDRFEHASDAVLVIGKAVFGEEKECPVAVKQEFFPLFIRLLRHGVLVDRKYIDDVWFDQYVWVIRNTEEELYLIPEPYMGDPAAVGYSEAMYVAERAKLISGVGYKTAWSQIEIIIAGAIQTDPVTAYMFIQDILDLSLEEDRIALLGEIMGSSRIYGLFFTFFNPQDPASVEYLLPYIVDDPAAFDMLIYTAEQEGFVDRLPDAYFYIWECFYAAYAADAIENCWIAILDTEKKLVNKPYCTYIMGAFDVYFASVFDDISIIPELKEEYVGLMFRGITTYGWNTTLQLTFQQTDMVQMCFTVDNLKGDACNMYLLNSLDMLAKTQGEAYDTAANLIYCAKRMNRQLNKERRKIMDDSKDIDKEKVTLMALCRMYGQGHEESDCLFYLKSICEGSDHWIAPLYVFYGLKYLYEVEPEVSVIINGFLDELKNIIKTASTAGRNTMLQRECQDIYHNIVQPHLYQLQQKTLLKAAQGTNNQELAAMFEIHVTKETPGKGGLLGRLRR